MLHAPELVLSLLECEGIGTHPERWRLHPLVIAHHQQRTYQMKIKQHDDKKELQREEIEKDSLRQRETFVEYKKREEKRLCMDVL